MRGKTIPVLARATERTKKFEYNFLIIWWCLNVLKNSRTILYQMENPQLVTRLKFWTNYTISIEFCMKRTVLPSLKGNNSCKTYNFRIKVGNVHKWSCVSICFLHFCFTKWIWLNNINVSWKNTQTCKSRSKNSQKDDLKVYSSEYIWQLLHLIKKILHTFSAWKINLHSSAWVFVIITKIRNNLKVTIATLNLVTY